MRLSVTEVLRRGLDNALANWPLLLLALAQSVVNTIIVIALAVAAIVPLGLTLGLSKIDWNNLDPGELVTTILTQHWLLLLWILFLLLVVLTLLVAVYSFFQAGAATVLLDGQRTAGPAKDGRRERFAAFTSERWFAGGRRHWWRVFWIYNIAWLWASIALLVPLALIGLLTLLLKGSAGLAIAVGCLGLLLFFIALIAVAIGVTAWCNKAIVVAVHRDQQASEALDLAGREVRADLGRTVGVVIVLLLINVGAAGACSIFGSMVPMRHISTLTFALMPLQLVSMLLQSIVSAVMSNWSLASFAAMEP